MKRYRGDTQPLSVKLSKDKSLVDLDGVTKVEFAIKINDEVSIFLGVKNADPTTGLVEFVFVDGDLDAVGKFNYDVQVVWSNNTKTTFKRGIIELLQDVNGT